MLQLLSGVQVYRKFYAEEKEKSNGVLAIGVSRSVDQPYISLARIISVSKFALVLHCQFGLGEVPLILVLERRELLR